MGFVSKQEKFSGHHSYEFAHGYKKASITGGYEKIKQTVPLKSENVRIEHSFDNKNGRSGFDQSIYHHDIKGDDHDLAMANYISNENPGFGGQSLVFGANETPLEFFPTDALTHDIGHLHFWLKTTDATRLQTVLNFEDSESEQALMVRLNSNHQLYVVRTMMMDTT